MKISQKDIPDDVIKFMKETDKKLAEEQKHAIDLTGPEDEVVYFVKEGKKIKLIGEEETLKNSLFPTLVKRVIRRN